jgi:cytochrome c oxidase subunit 2
MHLARARLEQAVFILFAVAAVTWSLLTLRWSFSPGAGRGRLTLLIASIAVAGTATASIISDAMSIRVRLNARPSDLRIRVISQKTWWQLQYERNGVAFTTANELHVPDGAAVSIEWPDLTPPVIDGGVCLPESGERCTLIAGNAQQATFVSLWPPAWRHLRIVADPPSRFESWFRNEAQPAHGGNPLFTSAGCGYCHVIRGVSASPEQVAPELTHFASRATIGAADIPNRLGYLTGWVVNSHGLKRGSRMPQNRLDPRVLHPLVQYLRSLQ